MTLVDAKYKFIIVAIGVYGKSSDGGTFSTSKIGKAFEKSKWNVPNGRFLPGSNQNLPYAMVGDEAFPLQIYILKPYPGP